MLLRRIQQLRRLPRVGLVHRGLHRRVTPAPAGGRKGADPPPPHRPLGPGGPRRRSGGRTGPAPHPVAAPHGPPPAGTPRRPSATPGHRPAAVPHRAAASSPRTGTPPPRRPGTGATAPPPSRDPARRTSPAP